MAIFNLNLDVIYALDTTGSMSSWINRSKRTIENISSDLSKQNIDTRFKVIGYKDVCDRKCSAHIENCPFECDDTKWVQISDFTKNPKDIVDFLTTVEASGGGDIPEDLFGALQIAVMQPWRINSKKVIIIITDAPPHGADFSDDISNTPNYPLPYDGSKLPINIAKELRDNNIQLFILFIEKNILEKTHHFFNEHKVSNTVASIENEPWKFSLIIPDDLTCIIMDIENEDKFLIEVNDGPFSSILFQLRRGLSQETLKPLIENCFNIGMKDTIRLVLYIRDRTGDIKEKDLGRNAFWIIRELNLSFASKYYKDFVNHSGCFNDLLHLSAKADTVYGRLNHNELLFIAISTMNCYLDNIDTDKGKQILAKMSNNKRNRHHRLKNCLNNNYISKLKNSSQIKIEPYFIYKWLPKISCSTRKNGTKKYKKWERENKFGTRISKLMFMNMKYVNIQNIIKNTGIHIPAKDIINLLDLPEEDNPERESFYREVYTFLSKLCDYLPIEVPMCANDWDDVEPSKATTGAQKKYKKCFSKRIPEKVIRTIETNKVKSSTLQGYDMTSYFINNFLSRKVGEYCNYSLSSKFVNSQWEHFKMNNKLKGNFSFQIDCSGSMLCGNPTPLSLALSLFLLSEQNKYISFEKPEWKEVIGTTLEEQISSILSNPTEIHGDISKGLQLALSQDIKPSVHFVLTDGRYPRINLIETINIRNSMNYSTRVIILNLRTGDEKLLVQKPNIPKSEGFYVVSGHSPLLIKLFSIGSGSIEEQIRKMLRDKFPLDN